MKLIVSMAPYITVLTHWSVYRHRHQGWKLPREAASMGS